MKLININLKTVGIVNSILLVAAIVLRVINITEMPTIRIIDLAICVVALLSGLVYSINGYKKDVAKYYKVFMYLYVVSNVIIFRQSSLVY